MPPTDEQSGHLPSATADLTEGVRRLAAQSRVRLAAVQALQQQHRLIAEQSRRRLEASRLLLDRARSAVSDVVPPEQSRTSASRG